MAKKEITDNDLVEIKKLLKTKKLVIGTEITIKRLKAGKLAQVFVSSNCPDKIKKDIEYYSKLGGTNVVKLKISNDELGIVCKKPFSISVLGVIKE